MKLVTPWKYNLIAPLIPKRWKPAIREYVMTHAVKHDMYPVPERSVFPLLIKAGDRVIDVGASIGSYTTVFSRLVEPEGWVESFEPITPTFQILKKSTQGLQNVTCYRYALSDHGGSEKMRLLCGDETVGEISLFRSTLERIWMGDSTTGVSEQVGLLTIDSLGLSPQFIKCDAEGHDWKVIQGANRTTCQYRPIWLVEINEDPERSPIPEYFKKLRYECFIQVLDKLKRPLPKELSCTQNYFFIPEEKVPNED